MYMQYTFMIFSCVLDHLCVYKGNNFITMYNISQLLISITVVILSVLYT